MTVSYEPGRSVATAAASGLAGLLIYCDRLVGRGDFFKDRDNMSNVFKAMEYQGRRRVIWVENLFGGCFRYLLSLHRYETLPEYPIRISKQTWNDETKRALFGFIEELQKLSEVARSLEEEEEKKEEEL
ncbi:hypothetical protein F4823DRAFT_204081 [Ustulina deusta]|nr:hypothetical protein F4823DRAFT_204081 [Ustulina deusta]